MLHLNAVHVTRPPAAHRVRCALHIDPSLDVLQLSVSRCTIMMSHDAPCRTVFAGGGGSKARAWCTQTRDCCSSLVRMQPAAPGRRVLVLPFARIRPKASHPLAAPSPTIRTPSSPHVESEPERVRRRLLPLLLPLRPKISFRHVVLGQSARPRPAIQSIARPAIAHADAF